MVSLFDKLVPPQGQSTTVEGEMVRAINRIWYRYNNDGDFFFKGYGLETANPSVKYLLKSPIASQVRPIILKMQQETRNKLRMSSDKYDFPEQYKRTDPYLIGLNAIGLLVVNYVKSKKGNYTPNTEDSR